MSQTLSDNSSVDFSASSKPPPSYAPVYAAMYPEFAEIFRSHGYALAIHGSLQRDFDLIAVPWVDRPSEPEDVLDNLTKVFSIDLLGKKEDKKHGRTAYTVSVGWGHCALDVSFVPVLSIVPKPWGHYQDHYRSEQVVLKTITVNPGCRLSLQSHQKRNEFWSCFSGEGMVEVEGRGDVMIVSGDTISIPRGFAHRLTNTGNAPLEIAEMQTGHCDENDITRLEDDYGRIDEGLPEEPLPP